MYFSHVDQLAVACMHELEIKTDFNKIITSRGVRAEMESDEEIRRVPEVGLELAGPSTSGREATAATGTAAAAAGTSSASQAASAARRRGRSPADKEHRRLKRFVVAVSRLFVAGSIASLAASCWYDRGGRGLSSRPDGELLRRCSK
jgi:hypothetical protein